MVYFIRSTQSGLIKIGKTTRNVNQRLRELQTGSAEILELIATVESNNEEWYHSEFKEQRSHGEWFRPSDALLSCIKKITEFATVDVRTCAHCNATIPPGDDYEGWDTDDLCIPCVNKIVAETAQI